MPTQTLISAHALGRFSIEDQQKSICRISSILFFFFFFITLKSTNASMNMIIIMVIEVAGCMLSFFGKLSVHLHSMSHSAETLNK